MKFVEPVGLRELFVLYECFSCTPSSTVIQPIHHHVMHQFFIPETLADVEAGDSR
jgi:hypothetical protein